MEPQMENSSTICIQTLVNKVVGYLSGSCSKNTSVIRINNEKLSRKGELHFLSNIKAWKCILQDKCKCNEKCVTIFQYFQHMHHCNLNDKTDLDIAKEVLLSLIESSKDWPIKIEKYSLEKEKVCLFLHRVPLIKNSIAMAVVYKHNYGRTLRLNKAFNLKLYQDKESELTTARLNLIQSVTENMLDLHGCKVSEEESSLKIMFTTKSEGKIEEDFEKFVCGVVMNSVLNVKETTLTWEEYIKNKMDTLDRLNRSKRLDIDECKKISEESDFLKNVAQAAAIFELLSVKPSRAVSIGPDSTTDEHMKGVTFILYNFVRITAIIDTFEEKKLQGQYPNLPNTDDVDFTLLRQEEEWDLVYNFIIGYQEMIKECLKCESDFQISPQVVCTFLSRLCHKFSIYYRRTKILTEAYSHLIPTMFARLYLLYALRIIIQNAFGLLGISSVSRM